MYLFDFFIYIIYTINSIDIYEVYMKIKKFEYKHKDVPFIKKDIAIRMVFFTLFFIVFLWQLISMFVYFNNGSLSTPMLILSVLVLVISLILSMIALLYAFRGINLLTNIKHSGNAVRAVSLISDNKKTSFFRIYSYLSKFIAFMMFLILVCGVTYSILEIIYYSTISFYMPMLVLFAISGFNSVYHIKYEMNIIESVSEYNAMYA